MSLKFKLHIFEGPLDLLLFLIKREKIDIYDIPIADITKQYIEYIEVMKMLDLEIAGEFLVMAATLIHIKSKMLLPPDEEELTEEEEEDPREELVRRLLEYKKYKEAALELQGKFDQNKGVFLRKGAGDKEEIFSKDGAECFEASLFDLIRAFSQVLNNIPKDVFHKVVRDEFTVSEKIHEIYHLLAKDKKIYFTSLFKKAKNKDEIITIFLAVLELMKMREVLVVQQGSFEEIEIIRNPEIIKNA